MPCLRLLQAAGIVLAVFATPLEGAERCLAIDGDTLVCKRQKVRLTNVYAAELNQAGGAAARRKLHELVHGRWVTLRPFGVDRYGRLLAEAYVDGRRIEQSDIGPRRGRGSGWQVDRHVVRHSARKTSPTEKAR